ncbi:MAG: uroporphyrinogen-III synthase [Candidatus Delongbacteria bacterium]|nr:uroporphyrinogen-III synthase [Candidatus Delongbacteria bacterium]MBN2834655.1 uroporphyrinogen-III synthase [Candidatus Delongbacteria bacterium]
MSYSKINILSTRPFHEDDKLTILLKESGFNVDNIPAIRLVPRIFEIKNDYDYVILTSPAAANFFLSKSITSSKIISIGKGTTDQIEKFGVTPFITLEKSYSEEVLSFLKTIDHDSRKKILYPIGNLTENSILNWKFNFLEISKLIIYENCSAEYNNELKKRLDSSFYNLVIFTSSSTVEVFFNLYGINKKYSIAVIGDKTEAKLNSLGIRTDIKPISPSIESLYNSIKLFFKKC